MSDARLERGRTGLERLTGVALAIALGLAACESAGDAAGPSDASVVADAVVVGDAAHPGDASPAPDAGAPSDASPAPDAGAPSDASLTSDALAPEGPPFAMDFTRAGSLYDAPFPSDDLRGADGRLDLARVPNPDGVDLIDRALDLIGRDARGFAQAAAIYLRAGAPVDPATLPNLHASVTDAASVRLVDVDPASPDRGRSTPIDVAFLPDGGPMGDSNLLAVLPLQGAPLRPATRYAAVVTRHVRYLGGQVPAPAPALRLLRDGGAPPGLSDDIAGAYRDALEALNLEEVVALAVFTTDDRAGDMTRWLDDARRHHPAVVAAPAPSLTETFDTYCVFQTTIEMPVYQAGTPPYSRDGGAWLDETGPRFDHTETSRLWFTVPRTPAPAGGWPTLVFIGTGGGGERPLVDRGACATPTFTVPIRPGSGPAEELAAVGWAGVQADGALLGPRNTSGVNEDLVIFNVFNPVALRDNIRQSALEIALLPDALDGLSFDVSACPGAGPTPFRVDLGKLALMGHSMGASIAPLTLAAQPAYRTALLSGAGASFIENVVDKLEPLEVRPIAEGLLGFRARRRALTPHDPALTLFQWAVEPADAQIYGRSLVRSPPPGQTPRNILILQGIVDRYILPDIANALSLSMGLDLAGPALDASNEELRALDQRPLAGLLPLVGRGVRPFPVTDNAGGATAVVVQNPGDDLQDGHEANFQTARPKGQYRCFLADVAAGTVPRAGDGTCGR